MGRPIIYATGKNNPKSKWYVSCVGKLCMTVPVDNEPPRVYEAKGVHQFGCFDNNKPEFFVNWIR